MHFQARANKLPEIHRRLVSIRTVMQHAIERMIRCNIPASVAASPINHERQRGDCAREQIDASPRRSEPKHASRSDRATVLIFGQRDHIAAEIRAVLSTSRRPAFKPGDLLALHASFSRSDSAFIIDLGWHQRALAHAARSGEHTTELQSLMRISYAVLYVT